MSSEMSVPEEKERPLARIPWIPFKASEIKLEDKKFFQEMATAGEEKGRRLEYYKILTKTFPFYLPKRFVFTKITIIKLIYCFIFRYHAMDCLALHKSSSREQYWANASHFLFCCQTLGFPFHANLAMEMESAPNPSFDKYRSYFDNEVLTSLPKVCKSA